MQSYISYIKVSYIKVSHIKVVIYIKYMITSTQITNTEIFTYIAALVIKLLNHKVLFTNRKDNRS